MLFFNQCANYRASPHASLDFKLYSSYHTQEKDPDIICGLCPENVGSLCATTNIVNIHRLKVRSNTQYIRAHIFIIRCAVCLLLEYHMKFWVLILKRIKKWKVCSNCYRNYMKHFPYEERLKRLGSFRFKKGMK